MSFLEIFASIWGYFLKLIADFKAIYSGPQISYNNFRKNPRKLLIYSGSCFPYWVWM